MSHLVPKVVEIQKFVQPNRAYLVFITKTWLKSTIAESVIDIPDYTIIRKDRASVSHGWVCLYIMDGSSLYTELEELSCCNDHEILWAQLRPKRLTRGFSSLIVAVSCHPH